MNRRECSIVEPCTIPSAGLVYSTPFNPELELASMTLQDEMRRLSPSDYPYKNLCDVLDDCILTETPISAYDMILGDYQYLIYKLRAITYGSVMKLITICPYCGAKKTIDLDLGTLPILTYNKEEVEKYSTFTLPVSGHIVELKMQTPRDLDLITIKQKEFDKKDLKNAPDQTLLFTLQSFIKTIDGKPLGVLESEDKLKKLAMSDVNTIVNYAQKLNALIGVENIIEITCDKCGKEHKDKFRPNAEFFRPALDI